VNLTIRPPIADFCAAAAKTKTPTDEIRKLFFEAARTHASNTMSTSRGHGFDRHFLALQWVIREDETVPALFTDPAYRIKRRPPQLLTNSISSGGLDGSNVIDHEDGLTIIFEIQDEL